MRRIPTPHKVKTAFSASVHIYAYSTDICIYIIDICKQISIISALSYALASMPLMLDARGRRRAFREVRVVAAF